MTDQQHESTLDNEGLWVDDPGKMSTYTRRRLNPLTMTPDDVAIEDIARALSMQCRYNGHVGRFYSVAEHCMLVAEIVDDEHKLSALLHDAAEAYLGDLIRPLKHTPFGAGYLEAEKHVEQQICKAFNLPWPIPAAVMEADSRILTEVELAGEERRWQEQGWDPMVRPDRIERDFLCRFREYNAGNSMVIGLSGYAQSGKDTLARFLVEEHGFTRLAFADILRDVLFALNPMVEHTSGTWSVQALVKSIGWDAAKTGSPEGSDFTVRAYLQRLGTEAGRRILGEDVWVNAVMDKVQEGRRYVFTDMRFPNEYEAIKLFGGTTVRLTREGQDPTNAHVSETALDTHQFDYSFHMANDPGGHLRALSTLAADLVTVVRQSKVAA